MSANANSSNPSTHKNPRLRPNTKRTGERSEAAFLHKASDLGFAIAKPWGDSERYDFILDNGERFLRVQIKATDSLRARAYETRATYTVGKTRAVYTRKDIDFLIGHVIPLDVWYIIPVEVCTPAPMLRFYPHRKAKKMRLEKYREAWHLLQPKNKTPRSNGPITLHASIEEFLSDESPCGAGAPAREPSPTPAVPITAVIPSGAPLQAEREPALSGAEGDLPRIATARVGRTLRSVAVDFALKGHAFSAP